MLATVLLLGLTGAPALAREPHRTAEEARTRMEYHLREVNQLATHFEGVLKTDCPRFDSSRSGRPISTARWSASSR